MKCYNHPDRDAVACCSVCGRALCKECTDKYSPIMCDKCKQEEEEKVRREAEQNAAAEKRDKKVSLRVDLIFALINSALGFFIAWGLSRIFDSTDSIFNAYYYAFALCMPFAWRTISGIIPSGGCLFTLLDIVLSIVLGPVFYIVGVWRLSRRIRLSFSSKWGIVLEILYILANIALIVFLYLLLTGLRYEYLDAKYPNYEINLHLLP